MSETAQFDREIIENRELSLAALGLYAAMIAAPDGMTWKEFRGTIREGTEAIDVRVRELEAAGIMVRREKFNLHAVAVRSEAIRERLKQRGALQCSWCGAFVHSLHGHHYPIPASQGGGLKADICGTCHADFHALERLADEP